MTDDFQTEQPAPAADPIAAFTEDNQTFIDEFRRACQSVADGQQVSPDATDDALATLAHALVARHFAKQEWPALAAEPPVMSIETKTRPRGVPYVPGEHQKHKLRCAWRVLGTDPSLLRYRPARWVRPQALVGVKLTVEGDRLVATLDLTGDPRPLDELKRSLPRWVGELRQFFGMWGGNEFGHIQDRLRLQRDEAKTSTQEMERLRRLAFAMGATVAR